MSVVLLTGSPLMYQLSWAAGFERPEVQLTRTVSPIWYRGLPPVILGPSSGRARTESQKV